MKKILSCLIVSFIAMLSMTLSAEDGVLIHLTDGTTLFFPSENVEYFEFVDDFNPAEAEKASFREAPASETSTLIEEAEETVSESK